MVARTGFEPVISALRGRCPKPLDERAKPKALAGIEGVEPPLTEPESAVLPLDDIPMTASLRSAVPLRKKEIYGKSRRDASPNFDFFEIQSNWPNLVQPVKDL